MSHAPTEVHKRLEQAPRAFSTPAPGTPWWQTAKDCGAWTDRQQGDLGYVHFGSVEALRVYTVKIGNQVRAAVEQAQPVAPGTWSNYVADMIAAYLKWPVDDPRVEAVAGIIERRKKFDAAPPAALPGQCSMACERRQGQPQGATSGVTPERSSQATLPAAPQTNREFNNEGDQIGGDDPSYYGASAAAPEGGSSRG